jgi:cell fate regulator YaaT (PSP1 superfamily)
MDRMVQVKLRDAGKVFFYETKEINLKAGEYCIVESDRGIDFGVALSEPEEVTGNNLGESALRKVIRVATKEDMKIIEENRCRAKEALKTCLKKIEEHGLNMKLVEAEYSFDRTKIVFYFTAEERVDFRALVKDLARIFKARIELKQIGVRDEAKLLGGIGPCGRQLCCRRFLREFEPVTIRMAKEQNLPLNPTKISGLCGRLMCCLSFESQMYKEARKTLPKEGQTIVTEEGKGKVISLNAIKCSALVELESGRQIEISY